MSTQHPFVMVTHSSLQTYTITQSCTGPDTHSFATFPEFPGFF